MKLLLPWLAIVATMIALDVIWIGVLARPLYARGIGHLMAEHPNFLAAIAFYLLYAIGLMAFVVLPRAPGQWQQAAAMCQSPGARGSTTKAIRPMANSR